MKKVIEQVINYVEDNITKDLSMDIIANEFGYSRYYLHRAFQNYTGMNIMQYVRRRKLYYALVDLHTNLRVIDVAFKYGYNSERAFSRAISAVYGKSPKNLRKTEIPSEAILDDYKLEVSSKERYYEIGVFSYSMNVKDIEISKSFYEELGFVKFYGDEKEKWVIMKNEDVVIGLFENIIDDNIITFSPGWNHNAHNKYAFTDVRDLQKLWKSFGVKFVLEVNEDTEGPGYFVIEDPDGNRILVDQHR